MILKGGDCIRTYSITDRRAQEHDEVRQRRERGSAIAQCQFKVRFISDPRLSAGQRRIREPLPNLALQLSYYKQIRTACQHGKRESHWKGFDVKSVGY